MSDLSTLAPSSSESPTPPASASDSARVSVESSPTSALEPHVGLEPRRGQAIAKRKAAPVKPPKASKVYKTVLSVIALRAQGVSAKEISDILGHSQDVLRQYLSRAYKAGWINISSFTEVDDQIEFVLRNRIIENVSTVLNERTADGKLTSGAREMTVEAAKGFGLFKTHAVQKTEGQTNVGVALQVKVEMPPMIPGASPVTIRPGTLGGHAALDIPSDAEVIAQPNDAEE